MSNLTANAIESAYNRLDELNLAYENIITEIKDFFMKNIKIFYDILEEMDGDNEYLYYDRCYSMILFNTEYCNYQPEELAAEIYNGYDENDRNGKFNPRAQYFRWDACGRLVSCNERDYSGYLNENTINDIIDYGRKSDFYFITNGAPENLMAAASKIAAEIYDTRDCLRRYSDY